MLRLQPDHEPDTLWDVLLPAGVTLLPPDLAAIDELLAEPAFLAPFRALWQRGDAASGRHAEHDGRPTLPMASYVRLMLVKVRTGWGYETLVREVSDSLHLRRFCLIALSEPVPDESTVRKLTRRLGPDLVAELIGGLIELSARERRFRPAAMRTDSTVVEADIRYPTDAGLAATGVRLLARAARRLRALSEGISPAVRDRSRSVGRRLRAMTRTLRRRTGEAREVVLRLTGETGELLGRSVTEARRALALARSGALEQGARVRRAVERLETILAHATRVVEQIGKRVRGEPIADRLVSFCDPDARPVRRGKIATPTQFGYVTQLAELTSSTKRGSRGLILPPVTRAGSVPEDQLLVETLDRLRALGLRPVEAVFDAGFTVGATRAALADLGSEAFIVGSATNAGSRRTRRRLARYRVGCEGRIAHLKREYGARRSRLRGLDGARIWESWAVLAYDIDTAAALPPRRRR
jgi:IS5 family transposase